jgi:hypothetical protein
MMDAYVIPDMLAIMTEMKKQGLDFETGKVVLLGNDVLMLQYFVDEAKKVNISMSSGYVWGWQEHNPAQDLARSPASRSTSRSTTRSTARPKRQLEPVRPRRL